VLPRRHCQSLILDNEQDAEVNEYRRDLPLPKKQLGQLLDGNGSYFSIVEPTTKMGCLFEPASNGIPRNSLYFEQSLTCSGPGR
jgi:hypothetical protein